MPRSLVIQLARFGDLLQAKRLILTLLARPGSETHLAVDRSLAGLARLLFPGVEVHPLAAHAGDEPEAGLLQGNRAALAGLEELDFQGVYNLNFSGLSFALAGLFDPAVVRGYRTLHGQRLRDQWAELVFRWTRRRQSSPLNLVDFWAALAQDPLAPDRVNPRPSGRGGGLGVVMAGRHSRRSLPMPVLAGCVAALAEREGAGKVVLLGSKGEQPLAREFRKKAPRGLAKLLDDQVGRTDWQGLMDRVSGLDLVVTPDTGTMHLAAHLGVPVEAMFLSSAWAWETGPYGQGHRVWQGVLDCSPCLESRPCPIDVKCLEAFASRDFLRLLSGRGGEPPQGLAGLRSILDPVGVAYAAESGLDPAAQERDAQRRLAADYLGLALDGPSPDAERAQALFLERDWMLENERTRAMRDYVA